ncbi:MAG: lipocalin-like domain-containing protein, partial [Terriglobales bacterium]
MKCLPLAAFLLAAALAPVAPSQSPATYRRALPGYQWQFPRDQGAHPAFANEWWYFTGNLASADGRRRFGFEVTFFRISPAPGAALDHDLYFTHFAISDLSRHTYAFWTRARRGDWSQAGASPTPATLHLWNENWAATFDAAGPRQLQA